MFKGEEEWVKNVFNKKIKTAIKNLPNAKGKIQSTKLNIDRTGFKADIRLNFKSGNWKVESDINKGIKDLLLSMGYIPKRLKLY
jgi:hypothetical protein